MTRLSFANLRFQISTKQYASNTKQRHHITKEEEKKKKFASLSAKRSNARHAPPTEASVFFRRRALFWSLSSLGKQKLSLSLFSFGSSFPHSHSRYASRKQESNQVWSAGAAIRGRECKSVGFRWKKDCSFALSLRHAQPAFHFAASHFLSLLRVSKPAPGPLCLRTPNSKIYRYSFRLPVLKSVLPSDSLLDALLS